MILAVTKGWLIMEHWRWGAVLRVMGEHLDTRFPNQDLTLNAYRG